ncbi:MAG: hypothetical protein HYY32_00705 [Chloroflexi bacterium]|nr:hypothetical protein [Chloroflexota bacterium]
MSEPEYEVVWPLAKSTYEIVSPTQRTLDLTGKTVCQLWNYCFKGDQMFSALRERLAERYPGIKFVDYDVFGTIHGPRGADVLEGGKVLQEQGCDLVIAGVGA